MTFHQTASGYSVDVRSPAGGTSKSFAVPFSDQETEDFLLSLRQALGSANSPQVLQAAREFGLRLFETVFGDEVENLLRSCLHEASRERDRGASVGVRLRLRLTHTPKLIDLPWELLPHPVRASPFALSSDTPLVRHLELSEGIRPLPVAPPLKLLAVVSRPVDYSSLETETEWQNISVALKDLVPSKILTLKPLNNAGLPDLVRWLQEEENTCNVLHFIGHGFFDPESGEGGLLFSDEYGNGQRVAGEELGVLLQDHQPLRMVVLNACEGGRNSRHDSFSGAAQALVRYGIPAVVAMQFKISDQSAITFATGFYSALAAGFPVDSALSQARKSMRAAGSELEACIPVLYMRGEDGRIFDLPVAAEDSLFQALVRRVKRYKRATVAFLAALLVGGATWVYFYERPRIESEGVIAVGFQSGRELATLTFPLVLRQRNGSDTLISSISASLVTYPPDSSPVYFAGSEIECRSEKGLLVLPAPVAGRGLLRLDCTIAKELGSVSVRHFLAEGNFRLTVNLKMDDEYRPVDICYFLKGVAEELRAGEVKTITISKCPS